MAATQWTIQGTTFNNQNADIYVGSVKASSIWHNGVNIWRQRFPDKYLTLWEWGSLSKYDKDSSDYPKFVEKEDAQVRGVFMSKEDWQAYLDENNLNGVRHNEIYDRDTGEEGPRIENTPNGWVKVEDLRPDDYHCELVGSNRGEFQVKVTANRDFHYVPVAEMAQWLADNSQKWITVGRVYSTGINVASGSWRVKAVIPWWSEGDLAGHVRPDGSRIPEYMNANVYIGGYLNRLDGMPPFLYAYPSNITTILTCPNGGSFDISVDIGTWLWAHNAPDPWHVPKGTDLGVVSGSVQFEPVHDGSRGSLDDHHWYIRPGQLRGSLYTQGLEKDREFVFVINDEWVEDDEDSYAEEPTKCLDPETLEIVDIKAWNYSYSDRVYEAVIQDGSHIVIAFEENQVLITKDSGSAELTLKYRRPKNHKDEGDKK